MTVPRVRKVVLAPNLIGAALIDTSVRRILERWRDGEFVAVMNRELLSAHLRELNRLGLPAHLVRRWAYWLSSAEKTEFVQNEIADGKSAVALCDELARLAGVEAIICWKYPATKSRPLWTLAKNFEAARR